MIFFFFNDTATTEIYTLSLHDALPIFLNLAFIAVFYLLGVEVLGAVAAYVLSMVFGAVLSLYYLKRVFPDLLNRDRKSTRLNSSHANISYAVFCLKKKQLPYSS